MKARRAMSDKLQACRGFGQKATQEAIDKLEACRTFFDESLMSRATLRNNENQPRRNEEHEGFSSLSSYSSFLRG
jgi:hypothetical protein